MTLFPLHNSLETSEHITNSYSQILHVRSVFPSSQNNTKAIVVSFHGYGAHINRPTHTYLSSRFIEQNIGYIGLDFHGHGYSQGIRGYIESPYHLLDDALSLLVYLYSEKYVSLYSNFRTIPLFIMGHSMGGGVSLLVSNILEHGSNSVINSSFYNCNKQLFDEYIRPCFKGVILFCPVIELFSSRILSCLVNAVGRLFPHYKISRFIFDENSLNHLTWSNQNYRNYISGDGNPTNTKGLSYGDNIQFGTLKTLMELSQLVQNTLKSSTYSFLVFHDPEDTTCSYSGTKKLMSESPSLNKQLININGGLHDILANNTSYVTDICIEWVMRQINK